LLSKRETAAAPTLRPGAALALAGVRPRKSRGQNFLVQEKVAERIVAAAALALGDAVVEIGPGLGILSERILQRPIARLVLIELDSRLAAALASRFSSDPRVTVVTRDFLDVDLDELAAGGPINGGALKVTGNLPFNIAAAILERLCDFRAIIPRMVLMFQREVADRIRAQPGMRTYSAVSAFTAIYWEVIDHFRVAAGNFHPRPKVDAAVLVFAPKALTFAPAEERAILATIRAGFSAPRKTIRNSLARGLKLDPAAAEDALLRAGIDPSARPGILAVADFTRLARALGRATNSSDRRDA
jgi:16S rRNA (adenine1518-N6/adenine1519-N6)-dimethyltransferase